MTKKRTARFGTQPVTLIFLCLLSVLGFPVNTSAARLHSAELGNVSDQGTQSRSLDSDISVV